MNEKEMIKLDARTVGYIRTIADAAEKGTVSREGMRVIGFLMSGWTLDSAKHKVFVEDVKAGR